MNSIAVAAALVFRDGQLLITQRYPDAHLGGLWEFPGGKLEAGESFENCLHRELKEELGIEVEVHEEIESITHDYSEKTVHLKFFRCTWRKNEPQPLGCADFRWINHQELSHFAFPAADARLVEKLQNDTRFWDPSAL